MHFTLFPTAIGSCGIVWGPAGIRAVQLPEGGEAQMRARVRRDFAGVKESSPPAAVQRAIEEISGLLRGESNDLSGLALDMADIPLFHRKVYEAARLVGPGRTVSYGELAARLGVPGAARAVGQALGRNPFTLVVPCHRVLAADGRMGGFSAPGGVATKLRLLSIEHSAPARSGELFPDEPGLDFDVAAAVRHLADADARLLRMMDAIGPCRLELRRTATVFGALARAIVYQQLTGRAAQTIHARLSALFPRGHEGFTAEQVLRTADARLAAAGLSRQKILSLRDLARKTVDGVIPTLAETRGMSDEAIIERLTEVRGIGRWTVEMLLIFRLGRPDVLPADDYGIRKGFARTYGKRKVPSPADVTRHGERWRPYRTVASWYLWRAADQLKDTQPA